MDKKQRMKRIKAQLVKVERQCAKWKEDLAKAHQLAAKARANLRWCFTVKAELESILEEMEDG